MHELTRNQFLKTSGFALSALAAFRRDACGSPFGMPIGIQPYTIRNELQKDFEGTLKQIAGMGYREIEISLDLYGLTPQQVRRATDAVRLATPSCFYPTPKDDADWGKSIEHAKSFGARYMLTTTRSEWSRDLDGWKKSADFFNHLGEMARKADVNVAYHNHNFEFRVYDGVVAYDEFLRRTDPALVKLELDCFWATAAGKDPVDYFTKYPGRFPLLHIKDLKRGYQPSTGRLPGNPFIEVGNGVIDWKRIFKAARTGGLEHFYVEQDNWDRPPLECAAISCRYLTNLQV